VSHATTTATSEKPETWREARSNAEVNAMVREWKRWRRDTKDRRALKPAEPSTKGG
jgi:hypothetical protein